MTVSLVTVALHCTNFSYLDVIGNWQRNDMFDMAYDKNPPTNTYQRDNNIMHEVFEKANVPLPRDKACNYPRSVGMNRAEMHGVSINNISRLSKHDINDKLNSSYMTQVPDKTMHANSGHFVSPDFEPYYVPYTHIPIPEVLIGKLFHKVPMHVS